MRRYLSLTDSAEFNGAPAKLPDNARLLEYSADWQACPNQSDVGQNSCADRNQQRKDNGGSGLDKP
jgi:hypothetical protein